MNIDVRSIRNRLQAALAVKSLFHEAFYNCTWVKLMVRGDQLFDGNLFARCATKSESTDKVECRVHFIEISLRHSEPENLSLECKLMTNYRRVDLIAAAINPRVYWAAARHRCLTRSGAPENQRTLSFRGSTHDHQCLTKVALDRIGSVWNLWTCS
jgi:hypothetical protein